VDAHFTILTETLSPLMKQSRLSVDSCQVRQLFITRPTVTYSAIKCCQFSTLTLANVNREGNMVNIFHRGDSIRFAVPRASGQIKTGLQTDMLLRLYNFGEAKLTNKGQKHGWRCCKKRNPPPYNTVVRDTAASCVCLGIPISNYNLFQ